MCCRWTATTTTTNLDGLRAAPCPRDQACARLRWSHRDIFSAIPSGPIANSVHLSIMPGQQTPSYPRAIVEPIGTQRPFGAHAPRVHTVF